VLPPPEQALPRQAARTARSAGLSLLARDAAAILIDRYCML
jgi:hypothetical protein